MHSLTLVLYKTLGLYLLGDGSSTITLQLCDVAGSMVNSVFSRAARFGTLGLGVRNDFSTSLETNNQRRK
jgi:hypothetical protein